MLIIEEKSNSNPVYQQKGKSWSN